MGSLPQMCAARRYAAAAAAAALATVVTHSCGKSPTASTAAQALPRQPTVQTIRIVGPAEMAPGDKAQYTVIAQLSNGSEHDVTATSTWRTSDDDVLSVAPNGVATAGSRPGQVVLAADGSDRRAFIDVLVLVPGTFMLSGTVRHRGAPIADATVDVLNGSRAVLSARTDERGLYRLFGVAGAIEIRATKEGYRPQVNRLTVTANGTSDFELTPGPAPKLEATYDLTITAAADCRTDGRLALPSAARTRTYTATLRQTDEHLEIDLSGADLLKHRFVGEAQGMHVTFELRGVMPDFYYYFDNVESTADVVERLSPTDLFEAVGHVDATVSQNGIAGTLKGLLAVVRGEPSLRQPQGSCVSGHAFVLTRRP